MVGLEPSPTVVTNQMAPRSVSPFFVPVLALGLLLLFTASSFVSSVAAAAGGGAPLESSARQSGRLGYPALRDPNRPNRPYKPRPHACLRGYYCRGEGPSVPPPPPIYEPYNPRPHPCLRGYYCRGEGPSVPPPPPVHKP